MNAVMRLDLGYDPARLLSAEVEIPVWKEGDDLAALQIRQRLLTRVRQMAGVEGAALVTEIPALRFPANSPFDIAGRDSTPRDRPAAGIVVTTSDYFTVVGVPLVAGRGFEPADAASRRAVAVLSAAMARRYWSEPASALGAVVRLPAGDGTAAVEATVVGVSRDTANPDVDQAPQPVMFLLDEHRPSRRMVILLRAQAPATLAPALRAAIRDVDADLPLYQLRTVSDGFEDENSSNRLLVGMFAAFAIVAVLLATTGLYGVMSYAVSQRTPEIAVRMALGAPGSAIAFAVVGRSVALAALGAVLGMGGALALTQAMRAVLFGVTATDPATYSGAVGLALAAAVVAAWLPMRRAAGIDPIQSLRQA
jgi:predicted permease